VLKILDAPPLHRTNDFRLSGDRRFLNRTLRLMQVLARIPGPSLPTADQTVNGLEQDVMLTRRRMARKRGASRKVSRA